MRSRPARERGAKIACVDIYDTGTMKQADVRVIIGPAPMARSPAPSCMCCSATVYADWPYLEKYTDDPRELEAHLEDRTPQWAEAICGCRLPRSKPSPS